MKAIAHAKLDVPDDVEIQPEHEVLYKQLSERHKSLLLDLNGRAVRSVSEMIFQIYQMTLMLNIFSRFLST